MSDGKITPQFAPASETNSAPHVAPDNIPGQLMITSDKSWTIDTDDALKQKHQNIPSFAKKISGSEGQQDVLNRAGMKSTNFAPMYGFIVNNGEDTVA